MTNWITILLAMASTKVLLNGWAGRWIAHAQGLRQGNPISPMLFVIIMEALNSLIMETDRRMALMPLPGHVTRHWVSLHADDLIVIVTPIAEDLNYLLQILDLFVGVSGLVTNIDKCVATPIRCSDEMMLGVQEVFPCGVSAFPCK